MQTATFNQTLRLNAEAMQDRMLEKESLYFSLGATSLAAALKCHATATILTSVGHTIACSLFSPTAALSVPVACTFIYVHQRLIEYDIQEARGDLESLPKNIEHVDKLLLKHTKEKGEIFITFTELEAQTSRETLKKIIKDAFYENKELTYFDPTSETLYCLNEERREPTKKEVIIQEIQASLENGQNYKGIVVWYAQFLLDKMPLYNKVEGEAQTISIHLYEYSTALSQIDCALKELLFVISQKN